MPEAMRLLLLLLAITPASPLTASSASRGVRASDASVVESKPNVFVFVADDMRHGAFGSAYTGNMNVKTPTIDAFARGAFDFTEMYTPTAMCAPARTSMMTGLYPLRTGTDANHAQIKTSAFATTTALTQHFIAAGYNFVYGQKDHVIGSLSDWYDVKPSRNRYRGQESPYHGAPQ